MAGRTNADHAPTVVAGGERVGPTPKRESIWGAALDFPVRTNPKTFYVVASTRRSGSGLLCHRLWATGVMGAPCEYFGYDGPMLQMAARLRPRSLLEYLKQLFALRTSPNGVFGFNAHADQFQLVRRGRLMGLFPRLLYVYVERADRVAQAVSLAKAMQSRAWVSWSPNNRRRVVYNSRQIRFLIRQIEQDTRWWEALFERERIDPVRIRYESLAAEPDAAVDEVLRRFGLARDPARSLDIPQPQRQSDAVNQDWIDRYRREKAEAG